MLVEIISLIIGFVLLLYSMGGSWVGPGSIVSNYVDFMTLLYLLVFTLPTLIRSGLWKDFIRTFQMLKKSYSCNLYQLKRSEEALDLLQKQLIYSGILIAGCGIVEMMHRLQNPEMLGPVLAIIVLSLVYVAVFEMLLMPLKVEVKKRLINYMEEEKE